MDKYVLKGYGSIFVAETQSGEDFLLVPKDSELKRVFTDASEYVSLYSKKDMQLKFDDYLMILVYPGMTKEKIENEFKNKANNMYSRIMEAEESPKGPNF